MYLHLAHEFHVLCLSSLSLNKQTLVDNRKPPCKKLYELARDTKNGTNKQVTSSLQQIKVLDLAKRLLKQDYLSICSESTCTNSSLSLSALGQKVKVSRKMQWSPRKLAHSVPIQMYNNGSSYWYHICFLPFVCLVFLLLSHFSQPA
jgi:hypothetical protein